MNQKQNDGCSGTGAQYSDLSEEAFRIHKFAAGNPADVHAALTVLASRQAIVIGPTPPGTGVIAPATSRASSNATSPTTRRLPSRMTRLTPTSITVAPGLIQSPRTNSERPIAANTRSARRHTAGRSRVLECATVTVGE